MAICCYFLSLDCFHTQILMRQVERSCHKGRHEKILYGGAPCAVQVASLFCISKSNAVSVPKSSVRSKNCLKVILQIEGALNLKYTLPQNKRVQLQSIQVNQESLFDNSWHAHIQLACIQKMLCQSTQERKCKAVLEEPCFHTRQACTLMHSLPYLLQLGIFLCFKHMLVIVMYIYVTKCALKLCNMYLMVFSVLVLTNMLIFIITWFTKLFCFFKHGTKQS